MVDLVADGHWVLPDLRRNNNWQECASLLRSCGSKRNSSEGKWVHSHMITNGQIRDKLLANLVIEMYGKCGYIADACVVYSRMNNPNVFTGNIMIAGFARCQCVEGARMVFEQMPKRDIVSWNAMVVAFAQSGRLEDAQNLFDQMPQRDVVSWTSMLSAYTLNGQFHQALHFFKVMLLNGVTPNQVTYVTVLDACAKLTAIDVGRQVHDLIASRGLESDVLVGNSLINMYGKCGCLLEAQVVFKRMSSHDMVSWNAILGVTAEIGSLEDTKVIFSNIPGRDVVSWTTMLATYARHGLARLSFEMLQQMQLDGIVPDKVTYLIVLDACAEGGDLEEGKTLHEHIVREGLDTNIIVMNALINMYGKCGDVDNARKVFDKLHYRDLISWNMMLATYTQNEYSNKALNLFQEMQQQGIAPDTFTYATIIDACTGTRALAEGKKLHDSIMGSAFETDIVVRNALIIMYGNCGNFEDAYLVFDKFPERDLALWNAMLLACANCGTLEDAQDIFRRIPNRDTVSWNTMLAAYARHLTGYDVFELFQQMKLEGAVPNKVTYLAMLDACANTGSLAEGKKIHDDIIEDRLDLNAVLISALIHMYGKCGSWEDARNIFDKSPHQVEVWNAMLAAYAQNGHGNEVLLLFEQMHKENIVPSSITLTVILFACSHMGLLYYGCHCLISMSEQYQILPTIQHKHCLGDLFARAGWLEEVEDIIESMEFRPVCTSWITLLGACRNYGDLERGKRAARHLLAMDPETPLAYVLLSNIHAGMAY